MARTIDLGRLPPEVASLLTEQEKPVFLERDGQPVGVIVSPEAYERCEQRVRRLFAVMDEVGALNADRPEREVETDIEGVIRDVRARRR